MTYHPLNSWFANEPEADLTIWRYMDLAVYLDMLQRQSLFFSRADRMADNWEGSMSAMLDWHFRAAADFDAAEMERNSRSRRELTSVTYLNCWHASKHESEAMWQIYAPAGKGIAVKSEWNSLTKSLRGPTPIHGLPVRYIDYEKQAVPVDNVFAPFGHKRLSFEHEHEVRLLHQNHDLLWHAAEDKPAGVHVQVDLSLLVHDVYVPPIAPSWFQTVVEVATKSAGFDWSVHRSGLAEDPIF